jgi:hypothetical protein
MDEQFFNNENAAQRAGVGSLIDPQQLAQLVMAAQAAQQVGQGVSAAQSAAGGQSSAAGPGAAPASAASMPVLGATDPFATGVGQQASSPAANPDPAKAAAIQNAQQAQGDPQASGTQAQANPQASATAGRGADPFPKVETPSAEDLANGNYIIVGFRHLLRHDPTWLGFHSYVTVPIMEDGKVKLDENGKPMYERWGVLGDPKNPKDAQVGSCTTNPIPGSGKNQQVRSDCRNDQVEGYEGKEVYVKVTPEQREGLRQGMQYFTEKDENGNFKNPCPVCGDRYHLFGPNSNEFIYNMLFWNPAGPIPAPKPPSRFFTPAYYVNDPNKQWYQKSSK